MVLSGERQVWLRSSPDMEDPPKRFKMSGARASGVQHLAVARGSTSSCPFRRRDPLGRSPSGASAAAEDLVASFHPELPLTPGRVRTEPRVRSPSRFPLFTARLARGEGAPGGDPFEVRAGPRSRVPPGVPGPLHEGQAVGHRGAWQTLSALTARTGRPYKGISDTWSESASLACVAATT